jgi:NDP-sugar pyrophosphorylase family protein
MVGVNGRPILEAIVEQMVTAGITTIYMAVKYRAEMIERHFGDGQRFGAAIHYLRETKKMGTAGALTLLPERPAVPLLVMNGDLVTSVPYRRLLDWHYQHEAAMTVGAVEWRTQVPYGVLERDGYQVTGVTEKPEHTFLCSAGMYVLEPVLLDLLEEDKAADMTYVLTKALADGHSVSAFPLHESWIDIGRHEDLQRATKMIESAV